MVYAKIVGSEITHYPSSLEYLVSQGVLNSLTPTPEELAEAHVVEVVQTFERNPIDANAYEFKPVQQQDGSWKETWVRLASTDAEVQSRTDQHAHRMVVERNKILAQSDWTQMPDVSISNKEAWALYRQALRDVPSQAGFPFSIQWPQPPQ